MLIKCALIFLSLILALTVTNAIAIPAHASAQKIDKSEALEKQLPQSKLRLGMQGRRGFGRKSQPDLQKLQTELYTSESKTKEVLSLASPIVPSSGGRTAQNKADATVVKGLNTSGTVRVSHMANLEALTNVISNALEVIGIAWGGPSMIIAFMQMGSGAPDGSKNALYGAASIAAGLATPGWINWLVASARDAGFFT